MIKWSKLPEGFYKYIIYNASAFIVVIGLINSIRVLLGTTSTFKIEGEYLTGYKGFIAKIISIPVYCFLTSISIIAFIWLGNLCLKLISKVYK